MSFSQDNGYTPQTVEAIMSTIMADINTQFGTAYTVENFVGTNFYKYFYALAQRAQLNEVKTSEIFLKLQTYFAYVNERISRPVNTNQGIVDRFTSEGYVASVKPMIDADAGKISICVDTDDGADDYDEVKLAICQLISEITVGGAVTQGTEVEAIVLTNGQSFDFKFCLPDYHPILLKLTIALSENNQVVVGNPDDTKQTLLNNIMARYRLGRNFEPQRYFSVADAPWAAYVTLEYSLDAGANWLTTVYDANFDDLLTFGLADITLVEV